MYTRLRVDTSYTRVGTSYTRVGTSYTRVEPNVWLTPDLFQQLDTHKSGSVDVIELKAIFTKSAVAGADEMDELGAELIPAIRVLMPARSAFILDKREAPRHK